MAELFCSIIVLRNIWKLESFFLKNLSGVDFKFINWVDSFFVNISPLTQSVLVVSHIEISAEQVPFFIHLRNIAIEFFVLLIFNFSQLLESLRLFFLNFGKFNLILFLFFLFLIIELGQQLILQSRGANNFNLSNDLFLLNWVWLVL